MCGIVGVYSKVGRLNKEKTTLFLDKSLVEMRFRGPDSSKKEILDNYYASGFVRLAIRDLSDNGMQPMQTNCKKHTITFNGEIYNTTFLLEKLKPYNISFNSTTDTEIILYLFKYFGFEKSINLLDGIFSIAYYNHITNELFLARDRAGTKPLYIYHDSNNIIFSSHYNHVVKNDFVTNRKVDINGLSAYIKLGYVPSGYGFYKNSFLLPQGTYIKINKNTVSKIIPFYTYKKAKKTEKENLKQLIHKTVTEQLISDVPIGTFLSGGIDSSIITLYANKTQNVKAFTIGFSDKQYDESKTAEQFAKQKNITFQKKIFDSINYFELIEDNIKAFSEPFSDYSSLPTLLLSKFTKKQVTVALSGDGGDELFYGYSRNIKYGNQAKLLISNKLTKIFKIALSKTLKKPLKLPVYEVLSNPNDALIESNYITSSKSLAKKIIPHCTKNIYFDFLVDKSISFKNEKEFLEQIRINEFYYHLQRILIKVDRASMYHSLEVRVPLLSNAIINASLQYEFEDCINNDKGKIPLRNILKEEIKGDLFNLPKKGFTLPLEKLINNDKSGIFKKYILAETPEIDNFFDTNYIKKMYNNHLNKQHNYKQTSWLLWSIFSLKAWYLNHMK